MKAIAPASVVQVLAAVAVVTEAARRDDRWPAARDR